MVMPHRAVGIHGVCCIGSVRSIVAKLKRLHALRILEPSLLDSYEPCELSRHRSDGESEDIVVTLIGRGQLTIGQLIAVSTVLQGRIRSIDRHRFGDSALSKV